MCLGHLALWIFQVDEHRNATNPDPRSAENKAAAEFIFKCLIQIFDMHSLAERIGRTILIRHGVEVNGEISARHLKPPPAPTMTFVSVKPIATPLTQLLGTFCAFLQDITADRRL